jgi:predicted dehydrogenase
MEIKDRVALIGNGYWGSKLKGYLDEVFNVATVADSKTDLNTIWKDDSIDSVVIATPINTHYTFTKRAIMSKKNVFVEKPLALQYLQCEQLSKLAGKYNVSLGVEYTQTFTPAIMTIMGLLTASHIGKIQYVEMSTRHLGRFMDNDVFWLLASHQLSILGLIHNLTQFTYSRKEYLHHNGLCTSGTIFFSGPFDGRVDVSTNYTGKDMQFVIYGSKGNIMYNPIDGPSVRLVLYDKVRAALPKQMTSRDDSWDYEEGHNLRHSVNYFKALIDSRAQSNADKAARVTYAIEESAKNII